MHDLDMVLSTRVRPKYRTKCHVGNWPAYDRALDKRDDITVMVRPGCASPLARGRSASANVAMSAWQYSDLAMVETVLPAPAHRSTCERLPPILTVTGWPLS